MKARNIIALALAGSLLATGVAYASAGDGTATPAPAVPAAGQVQQLDPAVRQQVTDKWAELTNLRNQILNLDKQLGTARRGDAASVKGLKQTRQGEAKGIKAAVKDRSQYVQSALKPLLQQIKGLKQEIKDARKANDTEKVKSLQAQATALRDQLKAKHIDFKSLGDKVKGLRDQFEAKWDAVKAALSGNKTLTDQVKAVVAELRTLNTGLRADQRDARTALKNKDGAAVIAALDKAIAAEKQILTQKTTLLNLRKQVGAAVQAATNSAK
ncbi:MAG: hypothetical protein ACYC6I_09175 [Bacillota bacterium]